MHRRNIYLKLQSKQKLCGVKCTPGFSVIEILLTVALSAFLFMPIITLLYSFYNGMHDNADATLHKNTFVSKTINLSQFKNGKIYKVGQGENHVAGNIDCHVMSHIERDVVAGQVPFFSLKSISASEINFPTSTLATGVHIIGTKVISSVDSSSTSLEDLIVYEYSDGALETRGLYDSGPGYLGLRIEGYGMYLANTSVNSQAHYINPSVLYNTFALPSQILKKLTQSEYSNFSLDGSNASTSPITKKIIKYKDLLILGTQKTYLDEVQIFNAITGTKISSINTEYGVNAFAIHEDKLIILGPQDPEIVVFDISNPENPQRLASYDLPGGSGNGRSIGIFGDKVFIGRSKGGEELMIFNTNDFEFTQQLQSGDTNPDINLTGAISELPVGMLSKKISHSVDVMIPYRNTAMLFTSNQHGEVSIAQVERDKINLLETNINLEGRVSDYTCFGNSILLSVLNTEYPYAVITYDK